MLRKVLLVSTCAACVVIGVLVGQAGLTDRSRSNGAGAPEKTLARTKAKSDPEQEARNQESLRVIRQAQDQMLTGDPNGDAIWAAPAGADHEIKCGVSPQGRYIVEMNDNQGATRDTEPLEPNPKFNAHWATAKCEQSSPVNSALEKHARAMDEMAWISRPIIADCQMREIQLQAAGKQADEDALEKRTHHCRDAAAWAKEQN